MTLESQDKVYAGQGEYVVFHGEKRNVSRETFERVYQILNQYSPAAIINQGSEPALKECSHRFAIIKSKVKEINPSLEIAFVPRTLYELVFIRKCIREDVKHQKLCKFLEPALHDLMLDYLNKDQSKYSKCSKKLSEGIEQRKCWHLCHFENAGDNDHPGVRDVAYRLNQTIVKTFSPSKDGFTYQELLCHADKAIVFLMEHYKNYRNDEKKWENDFRAGPTINFGSELYRGRIRPMGIRHYEDAQIIINAISLECSAIAQKAFLLYRGANFEKDAPYQGSMSHHLSYGTSLFAGCVFDGGATAFHYMRNGKNAYAIAIPFDQLNASPFYIPPTGSVPQLFGDGETFHGRTKAWKGDFYAKEPFLSNLSKKELIAQFKQYQRKAIPLK